METMTLLQLAFDGVLGLTVMWLAWRALATEDLFKGVVLFIAFGLLMALVWVRLSAPDIALAEAAIGAGLTGALLLAALAKLESPEMSSEASSAENKAASQRVNSRILRQPLQLFQVSLLLVLAAGLVYAVLALPLEATGLSVSVAENIDASGVINPVTAVLLNFRGYDTLLEMAVLFLALLGVWSLGNIAEPDESAPGAVLDVLTRLLLPLFILVAGYLLWVGAHAPGGAFQAGSVLAAAGVLLLLSGWHFGVKYSTFPLRFFLALGLIVFIIVALTTLITGSGLLEYPQAFSGVLILIIEAAATLSIGITLAALFYGRRPLRLSDVNKKW